MCKIQKNENVLLHKRHTPSYSQQQLHTEQRLHVRDYWGKGQKMQCVFQFSRIPLIIKA